MDNRSHIELHCHTNESRDRSVLMISSAVKRAMTDGAEAIAITDIDTVKNAHYWLYSMEHLPIKVIIGTVIRVIDDIIDTGSTFDVVLLCQNYEGLCKVHRLLSNRALASEETYSYKFSEIKGLGDGVLIGNCAYTGQLANSWKRGEDLKKYIDIYDYHEVGPYETEAYVRNMYTLANDNGKTVIATSQPYFIDKLEGLMVSEIIENNAIKEITAEEHRWLSAKELLYKFSYLEEGAEKIVIDNPKIIADSCEKYHTLAGKRDIFPKVEDGGQKLRDICEHALIEIYGDNIPGKARERLNKELELISINGYEFIFLYLRNVLREVELPAYRISSRGHVGNSLVAYLCGISDINPIDEGLIVDSFCNSRLGYHLYLELNFPSRLFGEAARILGEMKEVHGAYRTANEPIDPIVIENMTIEFKSIDSTKLKGEAKVDYKSIIQSLKYRDYVDRPYGLVLVPKEHSIYEVSPVENNKGNLCVKNNAFAIDGCFYTQSLRKNKQLDLLDRIYELSGVASDVFDAEDEGVTSLLRGTSSLGFETGSIDGLWSGFTGISNCDSEVARDLIWTGQIKDFEGVKQLIGLTHSVYKGDDGTGNLSMMKKKYGSSTITTREDVYDYLMEHGYEHEEAYMIMDFVRKGRAGASHASSKETWCNYRRMMLAKGIDYEFIEQCEKVQYLFPRAQVISYAKVIWRLGYFKIHYPEAFYKAYFEICASEEFQDKLKRGDAELEEYVEKILSCAELFDDDYSRDAKVAKEMMARGYSLT